MSSAALVGTLNRGHNRKRNTRYVSSLRYEGGVDSVRKGGDEIAGFASGAVGGTGRSAARRNYRRDSDSESTRGNLLYGERLLEASRSGPPTSRTSRARRKSRLCWYGEQLVVELPELACACASSAHRPPWACEWKRQRERRNTKCTFGVLPLSWCTASAAIRADRHSKSEKRDDCDLGVVRPERGPADAVTW